MKDDTNIWDAITILFYLVFLLVGFGGTAYIIQFWGWSKWTMLLAIFVFGSVSVKTGVRKYGRKGEDRNGEAP